MFASKSLHDVYRGLPLLLVLTGWLALALSVGGAHSPDSISGLPDVIVRRSIRLRVRSFRSLIMLSCLKRVNKRWYKVVSETFDRGSN